MSAGFNLVKSGVVFDEAAHRYTLGGKELKGVTPIVEWMFPETYAGVGAAALERAKERGSEIHEWCQMYNTIGMTAEGRETEAYIRLLSERGLKPMWGEYSVTDGTSLASSVDVVFEDGSLGDIKTTSAIHWENVALQLNIYRVWFERMNGVEVPHLYVIWLPRKRYGDCDIREVALWSTAFVEEVLGEYKTGGDPAPLRKRIREQFTPTVVPSTVLAVERELIEIERKMKSLTERRNDISVAILEAMRRNDVKSWDTGRMKLTRMTAQQRRSVDVKKLKADYPLAYQDCTRVTETKESVKITVREGK